MKNWKLKTMKRTKVGKSDFSFSSVLTSFKTFKNYLSNEKEQDILEEIRISRYQKIVFVQYSFLVVITFLMLNIGTKLFIFGPLIDYYSYKHEFDIFLNSSQQSKALRELQNFEEKLRFDILIGKEKYLSIKSLNTKIKLKANELAIQYNKETKTAIRNIFSDTLSTISIIFLIIKNKRKFFILNSVINEIFYGLNDVAKAFFIILFTDLFVGYHSSYGWEIILESLFHHFGLSHNKEFIFLFIATFPVFLDTIFKYWVFRYLNQSSPSAVATYRTMNK